MNATVTRIAGRVSEATSTAQNEYDRLVTLVADDVDPEDALRVLSDAGKSTDDLRRDVDVRLQRRRLCREIAQATAARDEIATVQGEYSALVEEKERLVAPINLQLGAL